jgi:hypothetical protein
MKSESFSMKISILCHTRCQRELVLDSCQSNQVQAEFQRWQGREVSPMLVTLGNQMKEPKKVENLPTTN